MKPWVGRSMIVIGALHSALGLFVFRDVLSALLVQGGFNTITLVGGAERGNAFWFLVCGVNLLLVGGLLDRLERHDVRFPAFAPWILLATAVVGCFLMPISGFWLLSIPVAGMFSDRRRALG